MSTLFLLIALLVLVAGAAYLVWHTNPAYTIAVAIVLSPISGHWPALGIPGFAAPDRLLLVGAVLTILLRGPGARDRPRVEVRAVHWFMVAAVAFAVCSAFAAGTLDDKGSTFKILESFGLLPFLIFLLAPSVFRTPEDRNVLLTALVALGGYLGITALVETIGFDALVFPKYILDPNVGIHFGRARGPFVEATTNGLALYVCAAAAVVAITTWRRPLPRFAAGGVALLCLLGTLFTLQRSVWVATIVATLAALVLVARLRRYLVPTVVAGLLVVFGALLWVPGLSDRANERRNQQITVWERKNYNTAALNMVERKPLTGVGWAQFTVVDNDYFELNPDYPLAVTQAGVHNLFLTYAAELGLIGLTLWLVAFLLGIGSALLQRAPPELESWRALLLATTAFVVVLVSFVPPSVFPSLFVWLLAGVVVAGQQMFRSGRIAAERPPAI